MRRRRVKRARAEFCAGPRLVPRQSRKGNLIPGGFHQTPEWQCPTSAESRRSRRAATARPNGHERPTSKKRSTSPPKPTLGTCDQHGPLPTLPPGGRIATAQAAKRWEVDCDINQAKQPPQKRPPRLGRAPHHSILIEQKGITDPRASAAQIWNLPGQATPHQRGIKAKPPRSDCPPRRAGALSPAR